MPFFKFFSILRDQNRIVFEHLFSHSGDPRYGLLEIVFSETPGVPRVFRWKLFEKGYSVIVFRAIINSSHFFSQELKIPVKKNVENNVTHGVGKPTRDALFSMGLLEKGPMCCSNMQAYSTIIWNWKKGIPNCMTRRKIVLLSS